LLTKFDDLEPQPTQQHESNKNNHPLQRGDLRLV
jgi:hypothetical protein